VNDTATSRVAMLLAPKRVEVREEAAPVAEPGGIVVRVRAALTDGTDLKTYRRGHPKMPMPTRFGHEFSGDVAAVGDGTTEVSVGDSVMCVHTGPCRHCFWCREGQEELCDSLMSAMILGAYSDRIAIPKRIVDVNCYRKPADVSYEEAAFLEPLACVVRSLRALDAAPRATVAITGNGAFGILHALLLQRSGAQPLLFGRRPQRIALAQDLGLESFDTNDAPMEAVLAQRTGNRGAEAAIECTGSVEMWERAPSLVRRGGTVSFFAGLPSGTRVTFDATPLHYDELRLMAPFHFTPADVRLAFELIASRTLPLAKLISDVYPLDRVGDAFARLDTAGDALKLAIVP
jgi:L-iditol 2-dehydrogenase